MPNARRARYRDEHEMIDRYVALRGFLSGAKAQDLVQMRGARCAACGRGPATKVRTKDHHIAGRRKSRLVCASCSAPWKGEELVVLKGAVDTGRKVGASAEWIDDRADEHRRLVEIFERRPRAWNATRWRFARFCAFGRHDRRVGSFANVAADGASCAPEYEPWWNEGTVRYWVGKFEAKIRARGERAGLLRRGKL